MIRPDYLSEGELIRMDGSTPEQMQDTLKLLQVQLRRRISLVSLFDWEYQKIKENQASLQAYFNALKKN